MARAGRWSGCVGAALVIAALGTSVERVAAGRQAGDATWSEFATGLENPRGLRFGPDGNLYVAEGGLGGTEMTTPGDCEQVAAPVGPYSGGFTGRISRIDAAGHRTTVVDGLPSSQTSPNLGSLVSGVADVDFIGRTMYVLMAGAGCSHGLLNTTNGVYRVQGNSLRLVADLSAWQKAHPVAHPEEEDFEPDGTWYSMVAVRGALYAVEPNHGDVVKVTPGGAIRRVVDVSASQGHIVPTSIAYHGNFFLGNLSTFPITIGAAKVLKLTPSGSLKTWRRGLTNVVGVAFDKRARMYVLESTVAPGLPAPGFGEIVRIDPSGERTTILSGLNLPTAMTFGPDGDLYVSDWGFGPPIGRILKVTPPEE
ncbi:MAG: repeat containing protein [Acidobacteria bacterium]|nr:repeat containing protein [Acidobacteriota bacterium]